MAFSSLLSKHGLALLCVARNPDSSLRDMADFVGVTGRAGHARERPLRGGLRTARREPFGHPTQSSVARVGVRFALGGNGRIGGQ